MKSKSSNKNLRKANAAKKDEFYTQLVDIEKELKYYKSQFRGKVVYFNRLYPVVSATGLLIHRLMNENDLHSINKAVSYLDRLSFDSISNLSIGCCFIAGQMTQFPLSVKVELLEPNR